MFHLAAPGRLLLLILVNLTSHANAQSVRRTTGVIGVAATHDPAKELHATSDAAVQQRHTGPARHTKTRDSSVLLESAGIDTVAKEKEQQMANNKGQKVAKDKARQDLLTLLVATCSVLFVLLLVLALLFGLFVSYMLGNMIKKEIELVDRDMIGTDIEVGSFTVSLLYGRLLLRDVKVLNPVKSGYLLPNLLTIDSVDIKVCVPTLLMTLGASLILKSLVINNVHVNVEKHSVWSSNVKEISDFLYAEDDDDAATKSHDEENGVVAESKLDDNAADDAAAAAKPWLVVHALKLQQMSVTLQNEFFHKALTSHQLDLADICYNDFDKESGGQKGTAKITAFLLRTLLKNVRSAIGM